MNAFSIRRQELLDQTHDRGWENTPARTHQAAQYTRRCTAEPNRRARDIWEDYTALCALWSRTDDKNPVGDNTNLSQSVSGGGCNAVQTAGDRRCAPVSYHTSKIESQCISLKASSLFRMSDKQLHVSCWSTSAHKRSTQLANISALWLWAWAHHWEQTYQRPPYTRFQYRLCRPTKRPAETSRNSV